MQWSIQSWVTQYLPPSPVPPCPLHLLLCSHNDLLLVSQTSQAFASFHASVFGLLSTCNVLPLDASHVSDFYLHVIASESFLQPPYPEQATDLHTWLSFIIVPITFFHRISSNSWLTNVFVSLIKVCFLHQTMSSRVQAAPFLFNAHS